MGRLDGKTALVTGSTRGIGRIVAEMLGAEGASLVISGRNASDVTQVVAELESIGYGALGIPADLSRVEGARKLAESTLEAVPRLDVLVNNAGMSIREPFWMVSDDHWDEQVNVIFRAPFILAQYAARHMREHGIQGRIVNTSTVGAHRCHADAAVYDSAKAAVEAMTRNMAWELGPDGITVNCVVPGPIGDRPGSSASATLWQSIRPFIPVGRVGGAADVAAAVLFFCLPDTRFITGQSLMVDGGYVAGLAENYL